MKKLQRFALRRFAGTMAASAVAAAMMATAALAQDGQDSQDATDQDAQYEQSVQGARERIEDFRGQREELARSAADVARQVDALIADDEALVAALDELDDYIDLQLSRIDAAEKSIAAAEAEAAAARAEADWLSEEIESIRERMRAQAIETFVQPQTDIVEQLSNGSLNENAVRLFVIDLAIGNGLEIADELRTAEAQLEVVRRRAVERAREAEREQAAQQQRLEELDEARVTAESFRAEIQRRIDEWRRDAAEIARVDKEMEREIFTIEAELRRAEEERRRRLEEARRRAIEEERRRHEAENGPFELVVWPADGERTSGFGPRVHPVYGDVRPHQGIDIDGDIGDRVRAARSGEVILAGSRRSYGKTVVVYHGLGYSTLYAHLSEIAVSVGDQLDSGDRIGSIGSTGLSTGPHLHFEIRIDGKAVDPNPYLP